MVVSLWGCVSVFLSSTSSSAVTLPAFHPLGLPLAFFSSLSLFLLSASFWWFPPLSLFSSVDVPSLLSPSLLSFHGRCPRSLFFVPLFPDLWFMSLLFFLCACPHAALFLPSVFSSLRPLHPAFRLFLVCFLAVFFLLTFAASFGSRFLRDGVALWNESLASISSFACFSESFSGLCTLLAVSVVVL